MKITYMQLQSFNFCKNCGNIGHSIYQCSSPITSNGLICFKNNSDTSVQYLMICRKNSLGYVDFLRGKYQLYNKNYLMNLINEMSNNEKNNLLDVDFDVLWIDLWGKNQNAKNQYKKEEQISKNKFMMLKKGIMANNEFYTIESLINESITNWNEPEWGFPKGRRNIRESNLQCAIREFEEETGHRQQNIKIIMNIKPFNEIFIGSNLKSYKHKYFIAKSINNCDMSSFQKTEVGEMKWFTLDEAKQIIRPYNFEKITILENVDKIIKCHELVSDVYPSLK